MAFGGFSGMRSRKILENLNAVMAILVFFAQVLSQILFNFFASYSESFTKYDAFCSHFFHPCLLEA